MKEQEKEMWDDEPFHRVNKVLEHYKSEELPVLENALGDTLIRPTYRKQMKKDFQKALIADLNDLIRVDLGEAVMTQDGMMIVVQNDFEGYFTIQVDTKFKNLDYDAYDPTNLVEEEDQLTLHEMERSRVVAACGNIPLQFNIAIGLRPLQLSASEEALGTPPPPRWLHPN